MKCYLVGGAVRDQLLGLSSKDRDFVVVGATIEKMLELGFKKVGKHFPVFIHPETKQEYALARKEVKVSSGHQGFKFEFGPQITLEEDLYRRDFTVNAIAYDEKSGEYVDPFKGKKDLNNKVLRHISDHFCEDPLRVLRAARFKAKLEGFKIASETTKLIKKMTLSGELEDLSGERILMELKKSFDSHRPSVFFKTLHSFGALRVLFCELDALVGKKDKRGVCRFTKSMEILDFAGSRSMDFDIMFSCLFYDIGNVERKQALEKVCQRLKVSSECMNLCTKVALVHSKVDNLFERTGEEIFEIYEKVDAFRKKDQFDKFITCYECIHLSQQCEKTKFLKHCYQLMKADRCEDLKVKFKAAQLGVEIRKRRIQIIEKLLSDFIKKGQM